MKEFKQQDIRKGNFINSILQADINQFLNHGTRD